ncbi:hypothetical protein EBS02_00435 [bacterium]|nr:hypothetical protein [bacterium]
MAIKISNTTVIADSRSLTNIVDVSSSGISTLGTVKISNGIVTATSGVVTYYGDGKFLTGVGVGIQSGGQQIGAGITQLNFVGTGNTFRVSGNTVDIGIAGGGGSGVSTTGVTTAAFFANPQYITTSYTLNNPNTNYGVFGPIYVSVGSTITVGVGNTLVIV